MSTASIQLPKPAAHALIVAGGHAAWHPKQALVELGYNTHEHDDPYAAMLELCRRPLVYRVIVLSLQRLYRDELAMIAAVRRRFPHVSVWLCDTDGRQSALAEAMRLGAEALVAEDGLHRLNDDDSGLPTPKPTQFRPVPVTEGPAEKQDNADSRGHTAPADEPVLSADELRALLGDDEA
ncbi:MAG TPA: hypothetical protein VGB55_09230 [Tepidisphaeraceae bacterium]|jgi:hypothetical protein